jgi:hypothetical protein
MVDKLLYILFILRKFELKMNIKLDVPANFTVLEEDCGASTGIMTPGAQWCYCCNRRIACMVTKNIVNYDAPVKSCPTRDNAYVDIDIHF